MSVLERREKSLVEAVAILVKEIHKSFPTVSTRPIPPHEDEDFTLEARIPAGMDREEVMNECIRHALRVEEQFGFAILTRVKETENDEKSAEEWLEPSPYRCSPWKRPNLTSALSGGAVSAFGIRPHSTPTPLLVFRALHLFP